MVASRRRLAAGKLDVLYHQALDLGRNRGEPGAQLVTDKRNRVGCSGKDQLEAAGELLDQSHREQRDIVLARMVVRSKT
jgi:hypothetical protein